MILIGLSDIHGHTTMIDKISADLAEADIVLVVGDITNFGGAAAARQVIVKIRRYARTLLALSGNCDYKEVDDYLEQEAINLHGKGRVADGMGFVGLGGSLITPFKHLTSIPKANWPPFWKADMPLCRRIPRLFWYLINRRSIQHATGFIPAVMSEVNR